MFSLTRIQMIFILAVLAAVPMWILPVAPLADWPVHLGISREIFLLWTGQISSQFYHIDSSFLGYASLHGALTGLQFIFPIEIAGKLVLTALFVLSAACWWFFFDRLDPKKTEWCAFGILANYTSFLYYGTISYLFALHFGLVWLALGIEAVRENRPNILPFLLVGLLVYLTHGQVFFLLTAALLLIIGYQRFWKGKPVGEMVWIPLILLTAFATINMITNPVMTRDYSQMYQVGLCAEQQVVDATKQQFTITNYFFTQFTTGVYHKLSTLNLFSIFGTIFPMGLIAVIAVLLLIQKIAALVMESLRTGKTIPQLEEIREKYISFDRFYLGVAAFFLLCFLTTPLDIYLMTGFADRSILFFFAFLLISIKIEPKHQMIKDIVFVTMVALILANIVYQAVIFTQYAPEQARILEKIKTISKEIPDDSALFIIPANWSEFSLPNKHLSAHYNGLLLVENPKAYVPGLFLYQDTFILRSDSRSFDDFVTWGPSQDNYDPKEFGTLNITKCYSVIPDQYSYYIDPNLELRKNPSGTNRS